MYSKLLFKQALTLGINLQCRKKKNVNLFMFIIRIIIQVYFQFNGCNYVKNIYKEPPRFKAHRLEINACENANIRILASHSILGFRTLRGPLSKIHPLVWGRKNRFSSYFAYELDFGQY
jgi:hypothetical protein